MNELNENIKKYQEFASTLEGNRFGQRACFLAIGISHYKLNQYEKAHDAFSRAERLLKEPHAYDLPALISKAHCHFAREEYETVTALLKNVDDKEARNLCALAYQQLGTTLNLQ